MTYAIDASSYYKHMPDLANFGWMSQMISSICIFLMNLFSNVAKFSEKRSKLTEQKSFLQCHHINSWFMGRLNKKKKKCDH